MIARDQKLIPRLSFEGPSRVEIGRAARLAPGRAQGETALGRRVFIEDWPIRAEFQNHFLGRLAFDLDGFADLPKRDLGVVDDQILLINRENRQSPSNFAIMAKADARQRRFACTS